ncbi:MAG: ATP-grasp domain-containing protein, partial [Hyphococcus sp.]
MKKTVLLTLGRLPKALEVARCLYAAGCRVIIADPLNNHLSKPSRAVDRSIKVTAPNENLEAFLDDLHQIIQDENVDLVLPVSEEAIYVSGLAARMAETARLLCAPTEHLMLLHDKLRFNEMARGFGLNAPETCLIGDERARDLMARKDCVIKPVHGCSGRGVSFHRAGETDRMDAASPACLVQERIRGQELSTLT